jgi:putative hydrolase of the HAD superfamily
VGRNIGICKKRQKRCNSLTQNIQTFLNPNKLKSEIYMFDADGVVIQSEMFSHKYVKEFNLDISELDSFFMSDFQECLIGKSDLKIVIKPWLKKWRWSKSVDEFLHYWFKSEHNLNFELIETINELRKNKMKCVLATNQEKYRLQYMKREMGLEKIFDKIYSSNLIGFKKPEIQYYEYIIDDLNENPNNIIFYDDSPANIEGAESIGITSYLYEKNQKLSI